MPHTVEEQDMLIDAATLLEFYAWTRRRGLTLKDRLRVREAVRVIHSLRKTHDPSPPYGVGPDRFPCLPK